MEPNSNQDLQREVVTKRPCTLNNMVLTLRPAFELLEGIKGKNVILCFGTTGCGKSTMLNSLIYGSSKLEKKKITETVTKPDGTQKQQKRGVIEMKEEMEG